MLSEKIIKYLKENNLYYDSFDQEYADILIDLGIDLNTEISQFNLYTDAHKFKGKGGPMLHICWFTINSSYKEMIKSFHTNYKIPEKYIPLTTFEGEGGYFYDREKEGVMDITLGDKLEDVISGFGENTWNSFNDFLVYFFDI